jgi:3-oxoacyl-(acyl-carrier-protein) reductase
MGLPPRQRLTSQVALVTGGCRGIGRAISMALAKEGAHVAISCRLGVECKDSQEVAGRIREQHGETSLWKADVSVREEVGAMREALLKELSHVDILINNAGIARDKTFSKMEAEKWDEVIAVNLNGVFNCTQAFINRMLEKHYGRIVNIISIVGQVGNFGQANYAAAKAGIIGMTKTLAKELARKSITVNAVAPGFVETDLLAAMPSEARDRVLAQIPMGRFGQPEDVARLVRFLVTDGSYMTGQVLALNGGLYV